MGTTVLYLAHRRRNHKMKLAQFVAISCLLAVSSSAPQRRRNQNNVNTKFFTGNNAIDSAAWGAALGAGTEVAPGEEPREQPQGSSSGTTIQLATASSDSSVGSERLRSPTPFLGTPVVEYNYSV